MRNSTHLVGLTVAVLSLAVGSGGSLRAGVVTYYDSGHFTTETGPDNITIKSGNLSVTIAFAGVTSHNVDAPGDDILGTFSVTAIGGNSNVNTSGRFFLNLFQTAPVVAQGSFSATLAGSVKFNPENQAVIEFDQTSIRLPSPDGVTYTLLNLVSNRLGLDTPTGMGLTAKTILKARIDDSAIHASPTMANPEPATIVSVSIGGLMVLGYAWRRRKAISAA